MADAGCAILVLLDLRGYLEQLEHHSFGLCRGKLGVFKRLGA